MTPASPADPPIDPPQPVDPPVAAVTVVDPPDGPFLVLGVTSAGRAFRPSDWAERLAGVMATFQPPGAAQRSHLQYSPYVLPGVHAGHRCVRVDPAIAEVEPMALPFLLNFARDNDLMLVLPASLSGPAAAPAVT
jgi:hypothetical protein